MSHFNEMKIDKGIPMPGKINPGTTALMRDMKVGDSFLARSGTAPHVVASKIGIKVMVRKTKNPFEWRVWRSD